MSNKAMIDQLLARIEMLEDVVYGDTREVRPEANMVKRSMGIEIREDQYLFDCKNGNFTFRARCKDGEFKISLKTKNDKIARHIRNQIIMDAKDKPSKFFREDFRRVAADTISRYWAAKGDVF